MSTDAATPRIAAAFSTIASGISLRLLPDPGGVTGAQERLAPLSA